MQKSTQSSDGLSYRMIKTNIKIIFFGTPEFAVPALEALINGGFNVVAVVTEPDKPIGRRRIFTPSPIKLRAQSEKLKILEPKKLRNNEAIVNELSSMDADIGVIAAYGKIIPKEIIDLPKYGLLNIHPSLLPKYRGPSPIQTAILNGDKETGVMIMKIDAEMDHGSILGIRNYELGIKENTEEALKNLSELGAKLLVEILPGYLDGKIKPIPQDHAEATYTKKFTLADGEIKQEDTAEQAYNKIRALNPEPGTYWVLPDGKSLKILEAELNLNAEMSGLVGLGVLNKKPVIFLNGGVIFLNKVQLEGKKAMSGDDFVNGYRDLFK